MAEKKKWAPKDAEKLAQLREKTPGLIRLRAVLELTGLSKTGVYAKMAAGEFPASLKPSANVTAWRRADVLAWLDELEAA